MVHLHPSLSRSVTEARGQWPLKMSGVKFFAQSALIRRRIHRAPCSWGRGRFDVVPFRRAATAWCFKEVGGLTLAELHEDASLFQ
jgi:hypothetical protein